MNRPHPHRGSVTDRAAVPARSGTGESGFCTSDRRAEHSHPRSTFQTARTISCTTGSHPALGSRAEHSHPRSTFLTARTILCTTGSHPALGSRAKHNHPRTTCSRPVSLSARAISCAAGSQPVVLIESLRP
ncbi:hypothetical protein Caci_8484 [Catenulispora acidiphila DSM 44928]|uniref:Uncharacterized protein n=1 Tax=Catenulispora acidiphila (strain DSM 44928 / JCM 14897 / NBRC 102108 / NRRL B-24433 / ID139908) TaxID=479433 RepID=C7PYI5_CATAD|nr:hypothetical protein Caci_8484 [Catenulispora acidiphila DSM 44928]